jgi:agmatinase
LALPLTGWQQEVDQGIRYGLEAAESIVDRRISTFSRGELPHYAGINTFMKAPYIEDVHRVGEFDVAIVGVPHDSGTTYRPGTRFGPQGIRRISALYTPYNYEMGVDLREQIKLCDVGDIFTIPANNEKSFDQISKGIAHVFSSGAFPIILGGDHSIGFPTVRGVCRHLGDKKVGIIHFDRHVDTQEIDLDERMHTCPWFHATNMANAPAENLVQLGIGGWQVPREGVKVCRERAPTCSRSPTSVTWVWKRPPSMRLSGPPMAPIAFISRLILIASMPALCPAPAGPNRGACCRGKPSNCWS